MVCGQNAPSCDPLMLNNAKFACFSGNAAFIAAMAADAGLKPNTYRDFAKAQINYMLGDNSRGSYVIGFGKNPPNAPHHRSRYGKINATF